MFLFTIANIEINVTTVTLLHGARCFTQHKTQNTILKQLKILKCILLTESLNPSPPHRPPPPLTNPPECKRRGSG